MLALLSFLSIAHAEKPQVDIQDDGFITVRFHSPVKEKRIRSFLADPFAYEKIDARTSVKLLDQQPPCSNIEYASTGNTYKIKMCENKHGFQLDLIESKSIKSYQAIWHLTPKKNGTFIDYRIKIEPTFYIPQIIVNQKLKRDVADFFDSFQNYFEQETKEKKK